VKPETPVVTRKAGPARFRAFLERQGPTFIKLGQYLALRPDLLPQEYSDELLKLTDRVAPFPWPDARRTLEEDFRSDPQRLFAFIDPIPTAAGSLAQVHRGRLADGTEVAVKIRRPDIETSVRRDLRRAGLAARLLRLSGLRLPVSPSELLQELEEWLSQEVDFSRELRNLTRLRDLSSNSLIAIIPRPYPQLCSSRVITTEYLRGIRFTDLLVELESRTPDERDRSGVAWIVGDWRKSPQATLEQMFRYRFFHADLHPGNLQALPGNAIGFVDFGLCDELEGAVRASQLRYVSAVYSGQTESVFKVLNETLIPGPESDLEGFRRDFIAETRQFQGGGARVRSGDGGCSPFGSYLQGLMRRRAKTAPSPPACSPCTGAAHRGNFGPPPGLTRGLEEVGREFIGRLQSRNSSPIPWIPGNSCRLPSTC
jgi:ubiquinone biosynthesis protein